MYDYSLLIGRITEIYGNRGNFARAMGISEHTMSHKLNNKRAFTQPEIQLAVVVLRLTEKDIPKYFFKKKVQ